MAFYTGHQAAPALQEAESQIHGPLHHHPINPVTCQLRLPAHYRMHPTFHVSLLKPYHSPVSVPSPEPVPTEEPPLPLILEDGSVYTVREILDSRRCGSRLEYLVDWEGYGLEERS